MTDDNDDDAAQARREARRAQRMSWLWWGMVPVICIAYWLTSKADYSERAMLCVLAAVSFIANAVSYSGKQKAAEAKAAGYENP